MSISCTDGRFTAPRETDELWPFELTTHNPTPGGAPLPVLAGVEACLVPEGSRPAPSDWLPAVVADGRTHVRLAGRAAGGWSALARVNGGPVLALGTIHLT